MQSIDIIRKERTNLMYFIAKAISKYTNHKYVLKGGTALMLFYELDRFSVDLDYDSDEHIDLCRVVVDVAHCYGHKNVIISLKKNTATTQRYMVHLDGENSEFPLKIECSTRNKGNIPENTLDSLNQLAVYPIESIAAQKAEALIGRESPRDIYDINFLLAKYPHAFSDEYILKIYAYLEERKMDAVLQSFEYTIRMKNAFTLIEKDATALIIALYDTLRAQVQAIRAKSNA